MYAPWQVFLILFPLQSAQESEAIQGELTEKVERLKTELVVFKSLMTDVSILHLEHFCQLWNQTLLAVFSKNIHAAVEQFIQWPLFY